MSIFATPSELMKIWKTQHLLDHFLGKPHGFQELFVCLLEGNGLFRRVQVLQVLQVLSMAEPGLVCRNSRSFTSGRSSRERRFLRSDLCGLILGIAQEGSHQRRAWLLLVMYWLVVWNMTFIFPSSWDDYPI